VVSLRIVARRVDGPLARVGIYVNARGTGYAPGDTVGIGADAIGTVDTIDEVGGVAGISVTTPGTAYLPGAGMDATTLTGSGSGLRVFTEVTSGDREDAAWTAEGLLRGDGDTLTWVGGSAPTPTVIAADETADWSVSVDVDGQTLVITATGEADKTVDWMALIEHTEMGVYGFRYFYD
jgi:hypothetical protein